MTAVIADAGPLIGLARLQHLELLRDIFGEVLITSTVRDEVLPVIDHADKALIQECTGKQLAQGDGD
ncbi:MAG: hypothetical protein R3E95_03490 [Thiolinea sp.]